MSKSHRINVSCLSTSFHLEELIDLIYEAKDYFGIEYANNNQRIRLAYTKLKGHAALLWKELHKDRKDNIN